MTDAPGIPLLARKCAEKGLTLRDARALFEAMWVADAVALHGSKSAAARAFDMGAATLTRVRNRGELMTTTLDFTLKGRRLSVHVTTAGKGRDAHGDVDLFTPDAAELLLAHIGDVEVEECICNFRAAHWVRPVGALVPRVVGAARAAVRNG
jgi:hypothetical protein